jgi:HD-GYP domain-containing protein (c-di-GMP phosphodiesterase class II)
MHTDACVLRLLDEDKNTLVINSSYCVSDGFIKETSTIKIGEGISGRVAKMNKPLVIYDIDKDPRVKYKELMKKEGIKSVLAVPVLFQDNVLGVISTDSRKLRYFSEEEAEVLSIFASQAAIAIQEARHYDDIHINYFNTIHALVLAIEARDPYTRGHTERVTKYALAIGRALPMSHSELEFLRYACEVHDVGKISIPDFILNKPGRLSPAERVIIELHPVKGAEMLGPLEFLRPAIPIVRHHHERYDGMGYPDGLEKESIPLLARILACADVFDALTSDRPYRREKLTVEEALVEIRNSAGSQFDPHIAHLFIKIIRSQHL